MTLKEIEFRIIPDSKTAYQLYKSKELDLLSGLPQEMIEKEKGNKEYKRVAGFSSYIYSFNVEKSHSQMRKCVKAFSLAVDRKFIVEKLYKNNAQEAYAFVPEGAKHKVVVISVKKKAIMLNSIRQKRKIIRRGYERTRLVYITCSNIEIHYRYTT